MNTHTQKSTHTPGPWVNTEFPGSVGVAVGNDSPANGRSRFKYWIASVPLVCPQGSATPGAPLPGASPDEARANARLITAAPEMLAALRQMLEAFESNQDGDLNDIPADVAIELMRQAIARAEGMEG